MLGTNSLGSGDVYFALSSEDTLSTENVGRNLDRIRAMYLAWSRVML